MKNTPILESKLKRHKISYSKENDKIVIGKAKTDYTTLLGLVALPIIGAIALCVLLFLNDFKVFKVHSVKVITGIVLLLGTGFFNISRLTFKRRANSTLKIIGDGIIRIKDSQKEYIFDQENIRYFECETQQLNDEIYRGKLYMVDANYIKYNILGFDDENEKYVLDDLKWFSEYFTNHVRLQDSQNNYLDLSR